MDLTRRINDSIRILQFQEGLTDKQTIEKKQQIYRKLAKKTAIHLYQKDGNKKRVKRIDISDKKKMIKKLTTKMAMDIRQNCMNQFIIDENNYNSQLSIKPEKLIDLQSNESSFHSISDSSSESVDYQDMCLDLSEDRISEDDDESEISELAELTKKTGMKPLAKKSTRFLQLGIRSSTT